MLFRRSPRTVLAWLGASVVAAVTANVVASDLAALHRRAAEAGDAVTVAVAARDLPLGATVARSDLDTARRFSRHLPPRAARDPDGLVGRVVVSPVLEGSVLSHRHLADRDRRGLDGVVPPGMRAVRVVTDDAGAVAPGAVVDVLVSFDPALLGAEVEPTMVAVRGAMVIGTDADPARERAAETGGVGGVGGSGWSGGVAGNRGVTLLTDPEGARRLAFAAANGIVTLTLAPPEELAQPLGPPDRQPPS